jgi:hypothetical protein
VRATLHDELMREAGFETDYYVELARRREERRKRLRRDVLRATTVLAFLGAFAGSIAWIIDVAGKNRHLPWELLLALIVLATLGCAAQLLAGLLTRDENERPRRGLRWLWKGITRPLRNDS